MSSKIKIANTPEEDEFQTLTTLNEFWGHAGVIIKQAPKSSIVINYFIHQVAIHRKISTISLADRNGLKLQIEQFFDELKSCSFDTVQINQLLLKHLNLDISNLDDKALDMLAPRFAHCNKEETLDLIANLAVKKLQWELFPDNLRLIIKKGLFFTLTNIETKLAGKKYSVFVRAFISGLIPFLYSATLENAEVGKRALWSLKDYEDFLLSFKPHLDVCVKHFDFYKLEKDQRSFASLVRANINPFNSHEEVELDLDELMSEINFDLHNQVKEDETLNQLSEMVGDNLLSNEELGKKTAYLMENIFGTGEAKK